MPRNRKLKPNMKDFTKVNGKVLIKATDTIFFGKKKGLSVQYLLNDDPGYLIGLNKTKSFEVEQSVINSAHTRLNWLTFQNK